MLYNASEPAYDALYASNLTPRDIERAVVEKCDGTNGEYTQKLQDAGIQIEAYSDPDYVTLVSTEDLDEDWYQEVLMYSGVSWFTTGNALTPGGDIDICKREVAELSDEELLNVANDWHYLTTFDAVDADDGKYPETDHYTDANVARNDLMAYAY